MIKNQIPVISLPIGEDSYKRLMNPAMGLYEYSERYTENGNYSNVLAKTHEGGYNFIAPRLNSNNGMTEFLCKVTNPIKFFYTENLRELVLNGNKEAFIRWCGIDNTEYAERAYNYFNDLGANANADVYRNLYFVEAIEELPIPVVMPSGAGAQGRSYRALSDYFYGDTKVINEKTCIVLKYKKDQN